MQEHIKHLLEQGEGLKVEFKTASGGVPKNLYETVCAFSNTDGGEILLDVTDAGEIQGIEKTLATQYKKTSSQQLTTEQKSILRFIYQ